jgi:hypothetical protein
MPEAVRRGWQRDYMKGRTVAGDQAEEHQTRLHLKEFTRGEDDSPLASSAPES